MHQAFESAVSRFVVAVCLAKGEECHEVGKCLVPGLVCVRKDLKFHQLVFGEVVALVHLSHRVEGVGLIGDDDPNRLAFFSVVS